MFLAVVAQVGFRQAERLFTNEAEARAWATAEVARRTANHPFRKASEDTFHYWIEDKPAGTVTCEPCNGRGYVFTEAPGLDPICTDCNGARYVVKVSA